MEGNKFTADFETTTDENDCRVWAWAMCEIGNPENFTYGNSLDTFMDYCQNAKRNLKVWFHNLKFDGYYIIDWLFRHGYEYVNDKKDRVDWSFNCLITELGQYYAIEVWFRTSKKHTKKVTFYDSLKILNFTVEQIAKDFALPIRKLSIDYKAYREVGHELTPEEVDYIRNDVEIMSRAMNKMFEANLTKITIGSDALASYKEMTPNFREIFPKLPPDIDEDIRESYKGGFTYCNPIYKEQEVGEGIVFDVNSLYPSRQVQEVLPVGFPVAFEGEYQYDPSYPLYVTNLTCKFELKPGKIPSIQIKTSYVFMPTEYLESSNGELTSLCLTNVDLELFFEQYNVSEITYHGGWKFQACRGKFDDYVNYWTEQKIQAKKDGNSSMYRISKMLLNSNYGKFGLSTKCGRKEPFLGSDDVVHFIDLPIEEREGIYIPIATFITSYARRYTITTSQKIRDWSINKYGTDFYLYSDTDSIHMMVADEEEDVKDLSKIIEIDDYKLGAWKLESRFRRGCFIRQKCYIEEDYEGKVHTTVAGFPKQLAPLISFENFKVGFTTIGMTLDDMIELARKNGATEAEIEKLHPKLGYKYVKGGVILEDVDFTIKP